MTAQPDNKKKYFFLSHHVRVFLAIPLHLVRPARHVLRCKLPTVRLEKYVKFVVALVWLVGLFLNHGAALANNTQANKNSEQYTLDIPSQHIQQALAVLAKQTEHQLLFSNELVNLSQSTAVKGRFTAADALAHLLQGSTLSGSITRRGVIIIRDDAGDNSEWGKGMRTKKNLLAATIAMFLGSGGVLGESVAESGGATWELEEIVVTATRREVGLQELPMAVSTLSSDAIDKRGLVSMDDYLRTLPGVSMQDRGAGQNSVVIRGVASNPDGGDSGAGLYFGETPLTDLIIPAPSGAAGNAEVKLVDIERIEVLRGPQGTLYGAGALSGAVRVIPASPNLEQIEGRVAVRYSETEEMGGDNNMVQGVISVPLIEDRLAIRAVAYRFDNSGYIKNVAASQPTPAISDAVALGGVAVDRGGVGGSEFDGYRLTALWQATQEMDITLMYMQQTVEQDGRPESNLDLAGDFQQARLNVGRDGGDYEFTNIDLDIASLTINYDFGWATLTSASSQLDYSVKLENDATHETFLGGGPFYSPSNLDGPRLTQEIRLASQLDGPLQFVGGFYYEDKEIEGDISRVWSGDPAIARPSFFDISYINKLEQAAVFGELSYQFADEWEVTVGGRHFDYERETETPYIAFSGVPSSRDTINTEETGQVYKANLSWTPDDDLLIYGQWSEGFRLGEPLIPESSRCDADQDGILDDIGISQPDGTDSDTTENFELGLKTSLADNRVTINAVVYRIDWEGIPVRVNLPTCNNSIVLNAGESKSEGVELEIQTRLTEQVRFDVSASYNDSVLTEDAENVGSKGDNLPGSADINFSAGLEYGFTLASYNAFARVDYSYVGEYYNNIAETGEASGDFSQIHLKAGVTLDKIDIDVFINNVTNANDFTWVDELSSRRYQQNRAYRLRPRTIGLNLAYRF